MAKPNTTYQANLDPELIGKIRKVVGELEILRKKIKKSIIILSCICVPPLLILANYVWYSYDSGYAAQYDDDGFGMRILIFGNFIAVITGIGIAQVANSIRKKEFRKKYKLEIVHELITKLYPSFRYYPTRSLHLPQIAASRLFGRKFIMEGDDYIKGVIGATSFEMSDVQISVYEDRSSRTIFHGLVFIMNFNKKFSSSTQVWPKKYKHGQKGNLQLEDPRFMDEFKVRSDDQVDGRYVLSTSLMERITLFQKEHSDHILLSFRHNRMYLFIDYRKPHFEPKIWSKNKTEEAINHTISSIQMAEKIVEDLNLNRRIWGA